jgi:hypothetical protein
MSGATTITQNQAQRLRQDRSNGIKKLFFLDRATFETPTKMIQVTSKARQTLYLLIPPVPPEFCYMSKEESSDPSDGKIANVLDCPRREAAVMASKSPIVSVKECSHIFKIFVFIQIRLQLNQ